MPRDSSGVYSKPAGTTAVSGTPVQSAPFNEVIDDMAADKNVARPLTAGGTGGSSLAQARTNLGIEADLAAARPIATGGTGATTQSGARDNLGITADLAATRPISTGGTGATTAAAARTNLGVKLIQSFTAANFNSVTFTGFDASIYSGYRISFANLVPSSPAFLRMEVSTNGGATFITSSNYQYVATGANAFTGAAVIHRSASANSAAFTTTVDQTISNIGASGMISIPRPELNAATHGTFEVSYAASPSTYHTYLQGAWAVRGPNTIVNAVRIRFGGTQGVTQITSGTLDLEGILR